MGPERGKLEALQRGLEGRLVDGDAVRQRPVDIQYDDRSFLRWHRDPQDDLKVSPQNTGTFRLLLACGAPG